MVENAPEELANTFAALMSLYAEGKLKPIIWREYPLESVAQALSALSGRKSWGKLVLKIS